MGHTFLLQKGVWSAIGHTIDASGRRIEITGRAVVSHEGAAWINESEMTLLTDPPVKFTNRYRMVPLRPGDISTSWTSQSSSLGPCMGHLVVIDDAMFSIGGTVDGHATTVEYLHQISEDRYEVRATSFRDGLLVVAMVAVLIRE